jgi:hypothetical protein
MMFSSPCTRFSLFNDLTLHGVQGTWLFLQPRTGLCQTDGLVQEWSSYPVSQITYLKRILAIMPLSSWLSR